MPRILVLADLGQPVYHVGDEAMGIAAADELTRRGYEVFIATRSPEHSESYIGTASGYLKTLEFPWPPAERETLLDEVRQHLAGARAREEVASFVGQVAGMDGIVIAGGGNMNSVYGWLLYERAAYALVARAHNIPLVVSGQSVGPVLTETDAETLREMLASARLVGVREHFSRAWAIKQGVEAHLVVDDATFYRPQGRSLPGSAVSALPEHYVCATLSGLTPDQARVIGQLLDEIHRDYGLRTVFLPHMGEPLSAGAGDAEVHAEVASHMLSDAVQLPVVHADEAVRIHRGAFIAFSTRYHPGVFSLSAGVPCVALLPDAFTDMRVRGMMAQYGAENYAISLALLRSGALAGALREVIRLREELSETLRERVEYLRGFSAHWWDTVSSALAHGAKRTSPDIQLNDFPTMVTGQWNTANLLVRDDIASFSLTAAQARAESDRALSWSRRYRIDRDRAREYAHDLERKNAELADTLSKARRKPTLGGRIRGLLS